jgi:predicted exporter
MRDFLARLLLALAITLVAFALASPTNAQNKSDDPYSASPHLAQQSEQQSGAGTASSGDEQTQDALAFTGRVVKEVVKERETLVLNDPVTKVKYQLDDQSKAKPFIGKQVKAIGKLEMNSNTIHIERIEPLL